MREGNTVIGDRQRGDLRDEERRYKVRYFKLADLPLAHQTHGEIENEIYDDGAEENGNHKNLQKLVK